ncbi:unnamed protein product [Protopolystoma xenopodis]|uniref:C2H2-type domain-containing protein n=1 Tax=Protopolystoma xenopodis TaxID=117903 RepID=A0A3S5AIV2_9PLAT|nr:unnamed protein product [Protopolystoma xenopodis]
MNQATNKRPIECAVCKAAYGTAQKIRCHRMSNWHTSAPEVDQTCRQGYASFPVMRQLIRSSRKWPPPRVALFRRLQLESVKNPPTALD